MFLWPRSTFSSIRRFISTNKKTTTKQHPKSNYQTSGTIHKFHFLNQQQPKETYNSKSQNGFKLLIAGFGGISLTKSNNNMSDNIKGVPLSVISDADKLFEEAKYEELLKLLKKQVEWEQNEQILWRVARCEFQIAKKIKDQKSEYEKLVNSAYEHVKKSLDLDDKNGLAHKWASILLDEVSSLKGTKERVLQVLNVRNHMEKAIEYAPTDPTSYYLLGEWHFGCYQVSWIERKIASIAFGKLPDADMEIALKMFEKAEEIEKDFYSKNKLMLAKTLLQLKRDKERAVLLLKEVVDKYANSANWDDKEAYEEALKLYNSNK